MMVRQVPSRTAVSAKYQRETKYKIVVLLQRANMAYKQTGELKWEKLTSKIVGSLKKAVGWKFSDCKGRCDALIQS